MLIATIGGWEYWQADTEVYRVAAGNRSYATESGVPANARWECSVEHFRRYEAKGVFVVHEVLP
jgi:hypothetical protein